MRIDRIATRYKVNIKYVHFPLHPETPDEGKTLEALFRCDSGEIAKKNAHMLSLMEAEGLPYGTRTHTYNSRRAQELATWAEMQPGGEAIHIALFQAYFVAGLNLAETDTLLGVIASVGLNSDEAEKVIETGSHSKQVDADWQLSRRLGVTGVPTYVANENGVVGAQPFEVIEQLVKQAGAIPR